MGFSFFPPRLGLVDGGLTDGVHGKMMVGSYDALVICVSEQDLS